MLKTNTWHIQITKENKNIEQISLENHFQKIHHDSLLLCELFDYLKLYHIKRIFILYLLKKTLKKRQKQNSITYHQVGIKSDYQSFCYLLRLFSSMLIVKYFRIIYDRYVVRYTNNLYYAINYEN